jgi:hypothetical protein
MNSFIHSFIHSFIYSFSINHTDVECVNNINNRYRQFVININISINNDSYTSTISDRGSMSTWTISSRPFLFISFTRDELCSSKEGICLHIMFYSASCVSFQNPYFSCIYGVWGFTASWVWHCITVTVFTNVFKSLYAFKTSGNTNREA